jgi:manganese-dependent ADP-ribose/CDP-alcohol diphosphatase
MLLSLQAGIHHIVLAAVLETPPGRDCYGHIEVHADRIVLKGVDTMMSLDLPLRQVSVEGQRA